MMGDGQLVKNLDCCTKKCELPFLRQRETIMSKRRKAMARVDWKFQGEGVITSAWVRENEGLN